jgi:cell division protein FtsI/penicillin-binding protein 2
MIFSPKGKYRLIRKSKEGSLEKHLAGAFYPTYGFGFSRSYAFRQAATQGSLFKIVTAFEALAQKYRANKGTTLEQLNPLEMTDKVYKAGNKTFVGITADGAPIPQIYKGGRIPRSHVYNLGHMDLIKAFETSSNSYFSLLASDVLNDPEDLANAAKLFSFGSKTGIDLPGEIAGKVPDDLSSNQTGLYATAIGQHSLVVTPLQTAVMLASLANGGKIYKPQIVHMLAGNLPNRDETLLNPPLKFPYQTALASIGIDFPLFGVSSKERKKSEVERVQPLIKQQITFPEPIRNILLKSMHKVVLRTQADSLWSLSKFYSNHPEAISDYIDLKNQLIGKTSTAESMERIDLDEQEGVNLYTHVWFGGIAFENDVNFSFNRPELVVIVYLRYGAFGKEAAPIAAQIVKRWRDVKRKKMLLQ